VIVAEVVVCPLAEVSANKTSKYRNRILLRRCGFEVAGKAKPCLTSGGKAAVPLTHIERQSHGS
jgi:hypothetical protein